MAGIHHQVAAGFWTAQLPRPNHPPRLAEGQEAQLSPSDELQPRQQQSYLGFASWGPLRSGQIR